MQLYHVSESCGFRENSELLVFSRLGEQKNLKNMLYYSLHAAIFLPTWPVWHVYPKTEFYGAARIKFQRAMQMDHMNWRQTIEITDKFSHGKAGNDVQLVLQHCCKTSWIAMLRV